MGLVLKFYVNMSVILRVYVLIAMRDEQHIPMLSVFYPRIVLLSGIVLVHGYQRIDPYLVLPDTRAAIEAACDRIAKGAESKEQVTDM
jgi:hypothetical protein